jgi:hypothetical protein
MCVCFQGFACNWKSISTENLRPSRQKTRKHLRSRCRVQRTRSIGYVFNVTRERHEIVLRQVGVWGLIKKLSGDVKARDSHLALFLSCSARVLPMQGRPRYKRANHVFRELDNKINSVCMQILRTRRAPALKLVKTDKCRK